MHTCINTPYIHIYKHAYRSIHIHTYIHTYIHTNTHSLIKVCIHIYIYTYIHTYIHTKITHTKIIMQTIIPMLTYHFHMVLMSGSHQNVITTKLVDGIALSHKHIKLLPLNDFPNGNVCMYVCMYVYFRYMYVICTYVCIYVQCTYVCCISIYLLQQNLSTCMYLCMCVCVCMYVCTCMYIYKIAKSDCRLL